MNLCLIYIHRGLDLKFLPPIFKERIKKWLVKYEPFLRRLHCLEKCQMSGHVLWFKKRKEGE